MSAELVCRACGTWPHAPGCRWLGKAFVPVGPWIVCQECGCVVVAARAEGEGEAGHRLGCTQDPVRFLGTVSIVGPGPYEATTWELVCVCGRRWRGPAEFIQLAIVRAGWLEESIGDMRLPVCSEACRTAQRRLIVTANDNVHDIQTKALEAFGACLRCDGSGKILQPWFFGEEAQTTSECPDCAGTGRTTRPAAVDEQDP